jgi:hypothetical protein
MASSPYSGQPDGKKRENPFLSLSLNILIPVIVLMKFSGEDRLGPVVGLVVALAFPITYGLYDFGRRRNYNVVSALGFISILMTGGIGLLKLDPRWIAVKEAGIPLLMGLAVVGSLKTRFPLVKMLFSKIIDAETVHEALVRKGTLADYQRRLVRATYIIASSFLLSAALNYALARIIVVSQPGTTAFNEELGKMTALSFPIIAVPSITLLAVAILFLASGIRKQTGLELKSIFRTDV